MLKMINKKSIILLVFTILFVESFLNPFGIISSLGRSYTLLCYVVFSLLGIYSIKYGNKLDNKFPYKLYLFFIINIACSSLMAWNFHGQGLLVSMSAVFGTVLTFTLLLFFLRLDLNSSEYIGLIKSFALLGMVSYIINAIAFPSIILGGSEYENIDMSRGIVRIRLPFVIWIVLFFFYSIDKWNRTGVRRNLYYAALCYLFILLSVTRQTILFSTVLGVIMILRRYSWKYRFLVLVISMSFYFYVLPKVPFINTMIELSEDQVDKSQNEIPDTRIIDYIYYCDYSQVNIYTRIFGNGVPGSDSNWQKEEADNAEVNKIYDVDVSWAVFYNRFGAISVILLLIILFNTFQYCKNENKQYVSYWILYVVATAFASGVLWFINQRVEIIVALAMAYAPNIDEE